MDKHSTVKSLLLAGLVMLYTFAGTGTASTICRSYGKVLNYSLGDKGQETSFFTEQIYVPVAGTITDISLALNIEHQSFCDLQIYLFSPQGSGNCINSYDVYSFELRIDSPQWLTFNSKSSDTITDNTGIFGSGLYQPTNPQGLDDFIGKSAGGFWQIGIYDTVYGDTGIIKGIRLDLKIDPPQQSAIFELVHIPEPCSVGFFTLSAFVLALNRKCSQN